MKKEKEIPIEDLVRQMSLSKPSPHLDSRVRKMLSIYSESEDPIGFAADTDPGNLKGLAESEAIPGRPNASRWRMTIAASLVAMVFGILVGRNLPGQGPNAGSVAEKNQQDKNDFESFASSDSSQSQKTTLTEVGLKPTLVPEAFEIRDGRPVRVFRFEGTSGNGDSKSKVKKRIAIPSSEI